MLWGEMMIVMGLPTAVFRKGSVQVLAFAVHRSLGQLVIRNHVQLR